MLFECRGHLVKELLFDYDVDNIGHVLDSLIEHACQLIFVKLNSETLFDGRLNLQGLPLC